MTVALLDGHKVTNDIHSLRTMNIYSKFHLNPAITV